MEKVNVLMACKLMPYYRLGVFNELSKESNKLKFYFFGDTKVQGGIKQIPFEYAKKNHPLYIRWIKTKNFFYRPERLLWQTGIINQIFKSKFQVFVFEGAIAHYPIWLYALLCKLCGKKVMYWTHGNRGVDKGLKKILRKILFDYLGDGLLLYGHFQRNNMIEDGYKPNKLHVIYNSLQPKIQFEISNKFKTSELLCKKQSYFRNPENFTLIFIGRLVQHKAVFKILEAQNVLKNKHGLSVNVIFIGDGPEMGSLKQYVKNNNTEDQVYFAGSLYNEIDIAPLFMMSDLMVSPGNVGLNCIHALAYGVPVLTHSNFVFQNPEVEAIVSNKTGVFYEYDNFDDMVNVLVNWIKESSQKNLIKVNCVNKIKKVYSPVNQSNLIKEAINSLYE